ncbi:MAG: alpha-ketoacid dehydrogenase subunit beta [Oceanospirillaceae bacterium]
MAKMNMIQALNSAMDSCMELDQNVLVMGEDVGYFGGVFRCTDGLYKKYGAHRALDMPIAEGGIMGVAIGMGVNGLRPIVEIQFSDYIYPAVDQIVSELARLRHRSGGEYFAPIVIRTPCGGGIRGGQTHSQSPEAFFTHACGLKTVMPSNPYDAKGLLTAAIESNDPVIFFEPKRIYNGPFDGNHQQAASAWNTHPLGEVPEEHYSIEIGKASVLQSGDDVTIITYGNMVHVAQGAINNSQINAELIDIRTLIPLDIETIKASVKKTGRCVIVHEATLTSGFGAEILSQVQEHCFWHLKAPIERVTGWDTPYPHAFEWQYFPSQKRITDAMTRTLESN